MPKRETPDIEVEVPPNEECPNGESKCDWRVAFDAVKAILGHGNITRQKITIFTPPVIVRIIREGSTVATLEFPSSKWNCLSVFEEHLRSRLAELADSVPLTDAERDRIKVLLEDLSKQLRDSFKDNLDLTEELSKALDEIDELQSTRFMEIEELRTLMGLEKGIRSRRQLAQIAGTRLSRWTDPSKSRSVKLSRAFLKAHDHLPRNLRRAFRESF